MSRFSNFIDAALTGRVRAVKRPMRYATVTMRFDTNTRVEQYPLNDLERECVLEAKFQHRFWVKNSLQNSSPNAAQEEMAHAVKATKRAMVEEMFGEFRSIIIELNTSLYDEDIFRARTLLAQLENQMFADGKEYGDE